MDILFNFSRTTILRLYALHYGRYLIIVSPEENFICSICQLLSIDSHLAYFKLPMWHH